MLYVYITHLFVYLYLIIYLYIRYNINYHIHKTFNINKYIPLCFSFQLVECCLWYQLPTEEVRQEN